MTILLRRRRFMSFVSSTSPNLIYDSKSLLNSKSSLSEGTSHSNTGPLMQIEVIQDLFHSEIDHVDYLQKMAVKLPFVEMAALIKTHKSIRDGLADIVHGNDITDVVNFMTSQITELVISSKDAIQSCQLYVLQYDNMICKAVVCCIWNRLTEYPKMLSELKKAEFSDSEKEKIEFCAKKFRWMLVDLHVFCQ